MNCFMKYLMADNQWTKSFDKERFTRTCLQRQSVSTDFRQPWDQGLEELHINTAYSYRMPQLGAFNRKLCVNTPMETSFIMNCRSFVLDFEKCFPSLTQTPQFMPLEFCNQTSCSWLFQSLSLLFGLRLFIQIPPSVAFIWGCFLLCFL